MRKDPKPCAKESKLFTLDKLHECTKCSLFFNGLLPGKEQGLPQPLAMCIFCKPRDISYIPWPRSQLFHTFGFGFIAMGYLPQRTVEDIGNLCLGESYLGYWE